MVSVPGTMGSARSLQDAARAPSSEEIDRLDRSILEPLREPMRHLLSIALATISALAVGCVEGEPHGPGLSGDESDAIGESQLALGEAACATVGLSSSGDQNGITRSTVGAQASPDWTYNPVGCPYQYIVEYTNLPTSPNQALRAYPRFLDGSHFDDITNEIDCERSHLLTGTYVWPTSTTTDPTIYTHVQDGVWSGTSCSYDSSGTLPRVDGVHKIRVAARAYYCALADGCSAYTRTSLRVEVDPIWSLE
ncbi:hypothetical protein WME75_31580 [Sorangium sp. So ce1014]|uniref:hypothetical protein n=1 Tax=Sorangium sp. So ce1014 TaxID=3133326 RepID=UPI003F608A0F